MTRLAAAFLLVIGATRAPADDAQEGWRILRRVAETYASAQDYTGVGRFSFCTTVGGHEYRGCYPETLIYKRPDRLIRCTGSPRGPFRSVLICTPKHCIRRMPNLGQYTRGPAPTDVWSMDQPLDLVVSPAALLAGVDLGSIVDDVALQRLGHYRGQPVYVLALTTKEGYIQKLWVGQKDFLIHESQFSLNPSQAHAAARRGLTELSRANELEGDAKRREEEAAEELGEWLDQGYAALPSGGRITATTRYKVMCVNSGIADEVFTYHPGPFEKRVDEFDFTGALE